MSFKFEIKGKNPQPTLLLRGNKNIWSKWDFFFLMESDGKHISPADTVSFFFSCGGRCFHQQEWSSHRLKAERRIITGNYPEQTCLEVKNSRGWKVNLNLQVSHLHPAQHVQPLFFLFFFLAHGEPHLHARHFTCSAVLNDDWQARLITGMFPANTRLIRAEERLAV